MRKIFISADIEGTCGIMHWEETEYGKNGYEYFRRQMTREVAAVCEGAMGAGEAEFFIKDAHNGARNLLPDELPQNIRLLRGWAKHPFSMVAGLDESFDGIVFTGYHSAAGMPSNPLSHTMNGRNNYVKINGMLCPELMINSLCAASVGVPVYCVTGDRGLCEWMNAVNPNIPTVPVNEGMGSGCVSLHPQVAVRKIRETMREALRIPREKLLFPMPDTFNVEICFKQHFDAKNAGWYPGCEQTGATTVEFKTDKFWDALLFLYWVL